MTRLLTDFILLAEKTDFDENLVTPTWVGFLITFALVVVTVLLIIDMSRRVRRTRYRAEVREQLEAERAAEATDDTES